MKTMAQLFLIATMFLGVNAIADFRTVDLAHEVSFANLRIPEATTGTLIFKTCDDCESVSLRATAQTRYIYNGRDMQLAEFRREMYRIRNEALRTDNAVTVLHNLETDTVVYVKVML